MVAKNLRAPSRMMRYAMLVLFAQFVGLALTGELLQAKRFKSFRTRTASTVVLIGGFLFLVWAGHVPLMLLVLALQVGRASYCPCWPPCHCMQPPALPAPPCMQPPIH